MSVSPPERQGFVSRHGFSYALYILRLERESKDVRAGLRYTFLAELW